MGLWVMIAGLVLFLGAHTFTTQRDARARIIASMGEGTYKIVYTLVSAAWLALIVWGFARYRATGWIDVWHPPVAMKHIAATLMLPAVILVVASYIRGRFYAKLKHPMLAGVKLWATAHLLANGDLGSIILFGSFLAYAVYDRITLKGRKTTTLIGTAAEGGTRNDLIAVGFGVLFYVVFLVWLHPLLIGRAVLPH